MAHLERTLNLVATFLVLGAIASLPSVLTEFPANLLLLILPAGLCLLIVSVHLLDPLSPRIVRLMAETAAVWVGYAVAWHNHHGEWDYQGVFIGICGTLVMSPLVMVLDRLGRKELSQ